MVLPQIYVLYIQVLLLLSLANDVHLFNEWRNRICDHQFWFHNMKFFNLLRKSDIVIVRRRCRSSAKKKISSFHEMFKRIVILCNNNAVPCSCSFFQRCNLSKIKWVHYSTHAISPSTELCSRAHIIAIRKSEKVEKKTNDGTTNMNQSTNRMWHFA